MLTTPYISRVLGAEKIGEYSFAQSIVSYFVLIAILGTTLYGQRAIAEVKNDEKKRSQVFFEICIIRCILVILVFGIYGLAIIRNVTNESLCFLVA